MHVKYLLLSNIILVCFHSCSPNMFLLSCHGTWLHTLPSTQFFYAEAPCSSFDLPYLKHANFFMQTVFGCRREKIEEKLQGVNAILPLHFIVVLLNIVSLCILKSWFCCHWRIGVWIYLCLQQALCVSNKRLDWSYCVLGVVFPMVLSFWKNCLYCIWHHKWIDYLLYKPQQATTHVSLLLLHHINPHFLNLKSVIIELKLNYFFIPFPHLRSLSLLLQTKGYFHLLFSLMQT